jgi:hypothetical protein
MAIWAYLEFPEVQAQKDHHNVERFRRAKAISMQGMGNGSSPLRYEVKAGDVDCDWEYVSSPYESESDEEGCDWGYSLQRC